MMRLSISLTCYLLAAWLMTELAAEAAGPQQYFAIEVVDVETGRGVPLVQLTTVHGVDYWTDSAGRIAFHEPGLMHRKVFFHISSHGYTYPADGFGMRGAALEVAPGGKAVVKVERTNIAERLYRITGAGIYRDSALLGETTPLEQPLLNAKVLGSDTVMNAVYRGRIHWFWGDTHRPAYPLGNFHIPGAISSLPANGGLPPSEGIELNYFTADDGFAKETCRMPGRGPTWIDGLCVLGEGEQQRMLASYAKIQPPLTTYARGLVEWDPQKNRFEQVSTFELNAPLYPMGHPFFHSEGGQRTMYFPKPMPWVRVLATADAYLDLSQYEAFTCFQEGSTRDSFQFDRNEQGELVWKWRRSTLPMTRELERELLQQGRLAPHECALRLQPQGGGEPLTVHSTSIEWNEYRQRWTMIALEEGGSSYLGEIWYAEAERPEGPWSAARKIISHQNYSFYNPKQHPMLAEQEGKIIYLEGTYTNMFSGNEQRTPRYDYNQVMYRLDLSDPRLGLPDVESEATQRLR